MIQTSFLIQHLGKNCTKQALTYTNSTLYNKLGISFNNKHVSALPITTDNELGGKVQPATVWEMFNIYSFGGSA